MHTGVCPERQYVSCTQRAPRNAYYLLPARRAGPVPLGPHAALLPTIALLAARGRELAGSTAVCRGKEAGTGEGSANLTSDCGVKEATVGIPEGNDQGEAQASRS